VIESRNFSQRRMCDCRVFWAKIGGLTNLIKDMSSEKRRVTMGDNSFSEQ
jgi:hypothetical protein